MNEDLRNLMKHLIINYHCPKLILIEVDAPFEKELRALFPVKVMDTEDINNEILKSYDVIICSKKYKEIFSKKDLFLPVLYI